MNRYLMLAAATALLLAACGERTSQQEKYMTKLAEVSEVWQTAKSMHPAWTKLYPVCLIEGDAFILFHPDSEGGWRLVDQGKVNMDLPKGVQAAFPMPFHNNETACVLDAGCFSTKEDITIVFHEFVHCYQMEICDAELKANLRVAQENKHTHGMWELQYPFPYEQGEIGGLYLQMLDAADNHDLDAVAALRNKIRELVSPQDWEYLSWQEFKEGTARWLQNRLAMEIGARPASSSRSLPINRVTFYEGGERMIQLLAEPNPALGSDFPALWKSIYEL